MKKRRIFRFLCWTFLFLILFAGALGFWLWHRVNAVPEFYRDLEITETQRSEAEKNSRSMERKVQKLRHTWRPGKIWLLEFTQDELNHWLAIAIGEKRPGMIPHQLKNPRGVILEDRILAGITVNTPQFQGVVSVEAFPTIQIPNTVDVELKNISAGKVKFPASFFESLIREAAQKTSFPVEVLNEGNGRIILRVRLREGDIYFENHTVEVNTLTILGKKIIITGSVK